MTEKLFTGTLSIRPKKTSTKSLTTKTDYIHGVQRRMISVDNFFRIFEVIIFCFVVAICYLEHAVDATYGLP